MGEADYGVLAVFIVLGKKKSQPLRSLFQKVLFNQNIDKLQ